MAAAVRSQVTVLQDREHARVEWVAPWARPALPAIVLLALLIRVSLIVLAPRVLDGDEALVGIQAERIAAGTAHPLPVFFYGQHYMGAIESYLAAGLFRLIGPSVPTLRVIPLLFAVAFVALTYHLTSRVAGRPAAAFAGLVAAFPPLYVGVISIKAWGGYVESLTLGTTLLLITHHMMYRLHNSSTHQPLHRLWLIWGMAAGLLFWVNPVGADYIIAAAGGLIWLAFHLRLWRSIRNSLTIIGLVMVGALLGGLPVWIDNIYTHGATFSHLLEGAHSTHPFVVRVPRAVAYLLASVLPKFAGSWEPWTGATNLVLGTGVLILYSGALVHLTAQILSRWRRRSLSGYKYPGLGLLLVFLSITATLFCISSFVGNQDLSLSGCDCATRYALPSASVLPIVIGIVLAQLWRVGKQFGVAALAMLIITTGSAYMTVRPNEIFQSPYWAKLPPSEQPLATFVEQHHIRHVWMNHWAGYPLMFFTNGYTAAADYNDVVVGGGINRLPGAMQQAAVDPRAAYILVTSQTHPALERLLRAQKATFTESRVGPYLVFWNLSTRVAPSRVLAGIGFAY